MGCVPAPPVIVAFSATPNQISSGESATLLWNVKEATTVTIDQGVGNVPVAGTKGVLPATTIAYTLTAANTAGTVTKSVVIAVSAESSPSVPAAETQPPAGETQPPVTEPTPSAQENRPPVISNLTADELHIVPSGSCGISCVVSDPDGDALSYTWSTTAGLVSGNGDTARWKAPQVSGNYDVTVVVEDGRAGRATATLALLVSDDAPDTCPPKIGGVEVSKVTETTAMVTRLTYEYSTSQVDYGVTNAYGSTTPVKESLKQYHRVELTNLEPDTIYHYRAKSQDAAGNEAIQAGDFIFRTLPVGDTTPPVISDLTVSNITESSVTVTWTTNEPSTSQIQLAPTGRHSAPTIHINSHELVTNHSVTANELHGFDDATYELWVTTNDDVRRPCNPDSGNAARAKCIFVCTTGASPISSSGPTVITNDATNVTSNSATLNGYLTSLGTDSPVKVSFSWGDSCERHSWNRSPFQAGTMNTPGAFSIDVHLGPGHTYYFRAVANAPNLITPGCGECSITGYGNRKSFTTTSGE